MNLKSTILALAVAVLAGTATAQDAIRDLIARVGSDYTEVRIAAIKALGARGAGAVEAGGTLVGVLDDPTVSTDAYNALLRIGEDAFPALRKGLGSPTGRVRRWCVELLGPLEKGRDAESDVRKLMKDTDTAVRVEASQLVAFWEGQPPPGGLPSDQDLEALLKKTYGTPRIPPAGKLEGVPADRKIDDAELAALLKNTYGTTEIPKRDAFVTLAERNRKGAEIILARADGRNADTLIELIKRGDGETRAQAVIALATLGGTKASTRALIGALDDPLSSVRRSAALALSKRAGSDEAAVAALIGALRNKRRLGQADAAEALGLAGTNAKAAVSDLNRWMSYGSANIRISSALALWRITGKSGDSLPTLIDALQHEDAYVRQSAAMHLGRMGKAAEAALPALQQRLDDEDEWVAAASAKAINLIQKVVMK